MAKRLGWGDAPTFPREPGACLVASGSLLQIKPGCEGHVLISRVWWEGCSKALHLSSDQKPALPCHLWERRDPSNSPGWCSCLMGHCCLETIELQLNGICSSLYSQLTHLSQALKEKISGRATWGGQQQVNPEHSHEVCCTNLNAQFHRETATCLHLGAKKEKGLGFRERAGICTRGFICRMRPCCCPDGWERGP